MNAEDSPFYGRGPSYYWSPDSSLSSRSFRTSSGVQGWQYDSKGRIYSYYRWNQSGPELEEWYSETGDLVGLAVRGHGTAYWKGAPRTPRQFSDSARVKLDRAISGFPDSTLVERAYKTSALTQIWTYDAEGVLQQYIRYRLAHEGWFSCGKAQTASIKEWFDENGRLLGFETMGVRYWDGTERTRDEYSRLWQEWRKTRPLWRRKPAA